MTAGLARLHGDLCCQGLGDTRIYLDTDNLSGFGKVVRAFPVRAEALAVELHTQVKRLLPLIALRLCLRFGNTRPTYRIKTLPAELVKQIAAYVVAAVREELSEEWNVAGRCWRKECTVGDHLGKHEVNALFSKLVHANDEENLHEPPSHQDMVDFVEDYRVHPRCNNPDEDECCRHDDVKVAWLRKMEWVF